MKRWVLPLLLTELVSCSARAAQLQCDDLPALFQAFERNHYAVRTLTAEVRARTVAQFIESVDVSRTLLLESDVAKLSAELPAVFDAIRNGNCALLENAARLVISRAEEDQRFAKTVLSETYALDESVELLLEPDKRGWAKTSKEREAIVLKMLHFQMSSYLLSGLDLKVAKNQLIHRYELVTKRLQERLSKAELPSVYAEAFAESLDPHTSFMSADSLADFQIQMRLSLEGIGAALRSEDGFTVIESLVPGGQAEKVDVLRPKDKIIAVAQENAPAVAIVDMELQEVVKLIRGKKGTKVTLTVLREGKLTKTFDVTITRDKIDVKEQAAKMTYETRAVAGRKVTIGILDLPSFYGGGGSEGGRSSFVDMRKLLEEAKKKGVAGVVLDLSRNGGGLLDDAVKISGLFLKKGSIVATKDSGGKVEVLADEDDEVVFSGPVVILTSPGSASGSEILAGALKAYRRAVIVGSERTFGKGTVQALLPLPRDLGAMKVTTGMFFLPTGVSTQQVGVPADVRVPSLFEAYELGEKSLDYSLQPQRTEPFFSAEVNGSTGQEKWRPVDDGVVAVLAGRSRDRVAKDAAFKAIERQIAEAAESRGLVRLADIRKKAKNGGVETDLREKAKEMDAAFIREGVNILIDLIAAPS